jgi:hypothetical protein
MKKPKSIVINIKGLCSILFVTKYPLPNDFIVIAKGEKVLDLDRKGLKACQQ